MVGMISPSRTAAPSASPEAAAAAAAGKAYSRRILLAVTGLTPQVVTETIFALSRGRPRWIPSEVHLLSTVRGAESARLELLPPGADWFGKLRREYRLPPIRFGLEQLRILRDRGGRPLEDIRTPEENEALADGVAEAVRELTSDPDSELHVSLAGGRKTMGFYAGYALSLYGRQQDRLSHVLVSPPFEGHREFFYPSSATRLLHARDNQQPLDAAQAEVTLAEIPFVRLRQGVPQALLQGCASFSETVRALNQAWKKPELIIDPRGRALRLNGCTLRLPPAQIAFVSWIARRHIDQRPVNCPKGDEDYAREYRREYAMLRSLPRDGRHGRLREGMDTAFFTEAKAKLKRAMAAHPGLQGLELIASRGHKGERLYELNLPADCVRWENE